MDHVSGQISIIPKPELRGFWGSSLIKPPFRVTTRRDLPRCIPKIGIKISTTIKVEEDSAFSGNSPENTPLKLNSFSKPLKIGESEATLVVFRGDMLIFGGAIHKGCCGHIPVPVTSIRVKCEDTEGLPTEP